MMNTAICAARQNHCLNLFINEQALESAIARRSWRVLFPDKMCRNLARVPRAAVFPNINSLPRAECETTGLKRDAEIHRSQRGANVRRHIVIALRSVNENRIAVGNESLEKCVEIAADIRIGILLNQ